MKLVGLSVIAALRSANKTGVWCATALVLGLAGSAHAQQQPAKAGDGQEQALEELVVTGSRIKRTTDFDTANPTTVVDESFLQNLGIVNVGDAVAQLPANVSNNTPTTTGNANFFTGSTIANLRGLNPFFGSRTLNLINGRRHVPTNQGDGVDLNFIPSVLIQRIDVVTGGASAAYGSGAVSGVNNIFLNRKLEGGKVDLDMYQTGESDGDDKHAGLAYGFALGDRGHLVLSYEYQDSDSVGCINARDWCAKNNGVFQGAAGQPNLVLGSNVRSSQMSSGGVFINLSPVATTTLQVNAAGTGTTAYNLPAAPYNASPTNLAPGGDGRPLYQYTNLRAPVERHVATGIFSYDLPNDMRLSLDLSWGKVETTNVTGALDDQFRYIAPTNAYVVNNPGISGATGSFGAPVGVAGTFLNKDWTSQVNSHTTFTTDVKRAVIGLEGKFGASTWSYDVYYQYGETDRMQLVADNRFLNRYNMAIDSVLNGAGQPVCRVTRDGFAAAVAANPAGGYALANPSLANGCVPINPFGTQPLSAAAYAYSFGYLREDLNYKQSVLAASASGDLFDGFGAGPVQGAIGVEYRTEEGQNIAAEELPSAVRTDFLIQYGESFSGDVDITEGFVELNVPFLRDRPGAKALELNLAARQSEYKNQGLAGTTGEQRSHGMFTWKASAFYDPIDWLRIRGSRSRDSRAANFRELYYGQIIQSGGLFGFCNIGGGFVNPNDPCTWSLEGNVNLKPEKADTTTIGIVFRPMEEFQFGADYFQIKITDAIQQANVARVRDGCRISRIPEFCALITFDNPAVNVTNVTPTSGITLLRAQSFNGSAYNYKGIDFTSSYQWNIDDANSLTFRLLATRMLEQNFENVPGAPFVDVVGQTGTANSFLSDNQPTADWVANLSATYGHGPLSVTGNVRYVSSGIFDYVGAVPPATPPPGGRTYSTMSVPSYQVFALTGSYKFENLGAMKSIQIFAAIENLFDKDPPIAVGGGAFGPSNTNGGTNAVFFDTMGRAFRVGVRSTF